jgi:hypothetical protein
MCQLAIYLAVLIVPCLTVASAGWAQTAGTALPDDPAACPATPKKQTEFFPYAEVRRGLRGVACTVFEGVNPEPMEVEILGVIKNARGPGQDMILGRLHGTKPEYTGVVAGMSGSPVYIDGKLLGALSFRIGQFSKEPICGITPIADMLAVRDGAELKTQDSAKPAASGPEMAATPIETPLVFGGFSQRAVDLFGDRFRALGLTPMAGLGGSDPKASQPEPIVPGSAVSAILVRGDLSMAGTCTVTYTDATNLLACGHPITQFGRVSMPMTKATVLATLASPLNAFKIIDTTETIGAFTQDRNSAILGRFGQRARMIPVTITVAAGGGQRATHFEVLDNKELTPQVMLISVFQSVQQTNQAAAQISYRLTGDLKVTGQPTVRLEGIMAPNELNPAAINTALYINERFGRIYANSAEQPMVEGMRLELKELAENRSAALEEVRLSRSEARPGETIEVEATVRPFRAPVETLRIPMTIPANTAPGELRLVVSDAAMADRLTLPSGSPFQNRPVALADMIGQMNRSHANDGLYVTLLEHDAQTVTEGGTLGAVPLSLANVLDPHRSEPGVQLNGETAEELGAVKTEYAVTGSQVLTIRVR